MKLPDRRLHTRLKKAYCICQVSARQIQCPLKNNVPVSFGFLWANKCWHIDISFPVCAKSVKPFTKVFRFFPLKCLQGESHLTHSPWRHFSGKNLKTLVKGLTDFAHTGKEISICQHLFAQRKPNETGTLFFSGH